MVQTLTKKSRIRNKKFIKKSQKAGNYYIKKNKERKKSLLRGGSTELVNTFQNVKDTLIAKYKTIIDKKEKIKKYGLASQRAQIITYDPLLSIKTEWNKQFDIVRQNIKWEFENILMCDECDSDKEYTDKALENINTQFNSLNVGKTETLNANPTVHPTAIPTASPSINTTTINHTPYTHNDPSTYFNI
jgi:hypothetical protein